jgi:hypothetical protein
MSVLSLFSSETKKKNELEKRPVEIAGVSADPDFNQSYNQLASKLGVRSRAGIASSKLLGVLAEESIHVYDLARVEAYLDKKGYWGWFPLRKKDAQYSTRVRRVTHTSYSSLYGAAQSNVYVLPVPYPALLTVDRIVNRCEATFFVAALQDFPDPFLVAISLEEGSPSMFVIERWDEPSFR